MQVLNPYFLVKVPKVQEQDKREKEGALYLHPSFVWMTKNTQCGVIENISHEAHKQLPEAKVGDILIIHHFAQGSLSKLEPEKKYLVHDDNEHNYYKVTAKEIAGINNQTYGVYNGETIIPNKDYVFLEVEPVDKIEHDEFMPILNTSIEIMYERMEWLKNENVKIGKTGMTEDRIKAIQRNEKEAAALAKEVNKKEHLRYKVAYANPSLKINSGEIVHALNIACNTQIEFNGKEYRVVETRFLSALN